MTKPSTATLMSALALAGMLSTSSLAYAETSAKPLTRAQNAAVTRHFELLEQAQSKVDQQYSDKLFNQMNDQLQRQESALVARLCTEHGRQYDDATSTCTE
jgi:acyl-CoA reductase-like NAD-dependent aldehyde dehydrogenase